MRKQNVLWKKRIAFLLSAALVFGEVGSNVNIIKAAEVPSNTLTKETEKDIEKDIEKTLPIPEEYISLNETEGMEEPVPVNAKEDNAEDIIPIIGKDDWKAKEQESEVVEEEVNCDGVQKPEEIMPSVIPVVGSGEAEVEPVTVNASDVTTPAAITVGDVISRNGVDNTYGEYVTEEFSFVPEEDGYYSMELKDTYSTQFSLYCGDENGIIYGNRLYIYDDYAGNYTRKLEAGKTYIWGVNYCLYEEDSYFSVEFKKNNELQITGNQVSGTAGKLSSFEYQPEKNTLVQISLESTKGYSYYLDSGSVAYKISNEKPLTFLYEGSDSQIYTLWKNTDEEDNVTLTIKSVTASVITETDVLEAVQDTKTQEVIGVVSKNAWVEFTPKESGYYAFESQKNNGHWQTIGRIYGYTENSETLECIECFDNYNDASNSCGIAKLNEGETYYYYISERYNSRNMEEIPSGMSVMVTKAEEQKISLGREYTFSKASRLTFDVEEGKLYQVLFTSNDQRTYVVDLEGLQNFDLYCYRNFGNVSLNSTWYASNSGEATLSIARLENLETDASYTVEVKEYNAPELPENEVQENKEALDWGDNVVYQFTPETDGTYNFWGICYTDYNSYVAIWKKNEYGIYCVENRGYNDEFDISAELEQGVTYYIVNTNDNNVVAQPGDYLLCRGKSASAEIDLTDKSEGTAEISMYKSAKVKINIPEKGFYQLMATGSADSYHINYEDASVLYNGIGKTVYFENTGEYIINLSREFPKGAGQDNVTFTIAKNNSITSLSTYTSENQAKEEVVLGDSDDVCWYQFTPEETGKYAFLTNRADEDSDVSLIFYREDAEENCMHTMEYNCHNEYGFRKYFLRSSLQAGVTYYVKATTYYDEGVSAELLVMKNPEGTVENMNETVTIDTMHSVSINCNIPEDGIYEVKLQAQKEGVEYAVMTEGTNTSWWWNYEGEVYTKYDYFSAGTRNIIVMPDRMNYGEDKISITLSQVETKTVLQNITMDKDTIWVKYTPEESGYYTIGSVLQKQETEDSPWMSAGIYYKTADDCISYCTSLYGGNDNLERSMYLDNTYEYYIKLYSDTIPVQLTVYAQMNEQVEKTLEQEFELTFAKACDITIPDLTTGWYEVSLEGDTEMYSLAFVNGDNYSEYYSNVGTTKLIYLDSEDLDYNDSRMCFEVIANGLPGENTCTMKISKINVESQEITLGTTISKTAESDVEAYSFTPEKQGYYCITSEGILEDLYFCDSEGYMSYWGSHTLYPGSTYTFYVLNQKGKDYSLTLSREHCMQVYDYNTYNAFIASGGSISIVKSEDITDEMWEDENYDLSDLWDGNYVVCSTENFKNKNDTWFLYSVTDIWIDDATTIYQPIDEYLQEYNRSYETHTYRYKYQYLCDNKGNKLDSNSQIKDPYIAYALYAPDYVPVQSITIQGTSALALGATTKLTAKLDTGVNFEPTNKNVTWSSSDSSIVSVDSQGNVKANKVGKAVITCKSQDKAGKSGSITIVVAQNVIYASKVVITGATKVNVGESITLKASIDTAGKGKPTKDGVTWSSSNKGIAKVDAKGKVTGVSAGKVTITATSNDGKAKADYTITVKNVTAKKISLNESKITMKKGTTYQWLEVSFSPKNTTNQKIKWSTSNKKVATVDSKGKIKAKGIGKAVITATSSNGKKDTVKITVTKDSIKAKKIKLSAKKTMKVGQKITLSPEFTPINTTNKKVKWGSSDTKIATVSSKGVVKAKKAGKVTITVTTLDGTKKTAKCKITVKKR